MRRIAVTILALSFAACGGDSKKSPDAGTTHDASTGSNADASPDGTSQVCTTVTPGMLDFLLSTTSHTTWGAPVTGDLGGGQSLVYQIEVWAGQTPVTGTVDLSMGDQTDYATCEFCVLAYELDGSGAVAKTFFQKSGTVTLSEDPLANNHLVGSFSNLELQEVTIDSQTAETTVVTGGTCGNFGSFNVDHDRVPNAFTCTHDKWLDGTTCDCGCGVEDADCYPGTEAVVGCTGSQACFAAACVDAPTNDTCAAATALTLGTPVNGTTVGAPNDYNAGLDADTCTKFSQPGSDVVYSVTLAANTQYTVALTGLDAKFDGSVSLVGPGAADTVCGATISTCIGGSDQAFEGQDETFTVTPTTAGTYYVIVDSFYQPGVEAGTFTLTVTGP